MMMRPHLKSRAVFLFLLCIYLYPNHAWLLNYQPSWPFQTLLASKQTDILAAETEIPILFETANVLVIDKPHGISHHGSDGILSLLRNQTLPYRIYGVHRLDRVTSGILVLAKTASSARRLTRLFREGHVIKYYTGLSCHKAKKKQGWVKGGMERGRRKSWYLTRGSSNINFARTRFFTMGLGSFQEDLVIQHHALKTLLLFRPYTGRTHQLRVAAKSVGLALAGDPVYSDGSSPGANRTCLHATAIHIPGDVNNENITIVSMPPFEKFWEAKSQMKLSNGVLNLFEKFCNCPEILEIVRKAKYGMIQEEEVLDK